MNMKNPVSIILGFCLIALLFMSVPIAEQQETREYDPWCDINDNGVISMLDIWEVARLYGTSGTPINKTALLLELVSQMESLNASLSEIERRANHIRTMGFFTANETYIHEIYKNASETASFNWVPENSNDNIVTSAYLYFEQDRKSVV